MSLQEKVCNTLKISLTNEKNKYVVRNVIATIQQLWNQKLGLSTLTSETLDSDKFIKARNKALKLLNKLYK